MRSRYHGSCYYLSYFMYRYERADAWCIPHSVLAAFVAASASSNDGSTFDSSYGESPHEDNGVADHDGFPLFPDEGLLRYAANVLCVGEDDDDLRIDGGSLPFDWASRYDVYWTYYLNTLIYRVNSQFKSSALPETGFIKQRTTEYWFSFYVRNTLCETLITRACGRYALVYPKGAGGLWQENHSRQGWHGGQ